MYYAGVSRRADRTISTDVAIVGAGPAGLLLANALRAEGIEHVLLEHRSEHEVRNRRRAGLLEDRTVRILRRHGLAAGLDREGMALGAVEFIAGEHRYVVDYGSLTGVTNIAYQQHDLVGDLITALHDSGGMIHFEHRATAVELEPVPVVRCAAPDGTPVAVTANVLAGCDGFHGAARQAALEHGQRVFSHDHRTTWLTLLAAAPPLTRSNLYVRHPRGFAGQMLRTESVTRFYLQVPSGDTPADWPPERLWEELETRLAIPGAPLSRGDLLEVNQLDMGVHVGEPMRFGPLYLLGDAAHVITPCGGKGMNLAIQDADDLAGALVRDRRDGCDDLLHTYSARRLAAAWVAQQFSNELLDLVTVDSPDAEGDGYEDRVRRAALARLGSSPTAQRDFGERYAGADLTGPPAPAPAR
jgi:p-hydroxybenzoate 3-monooxygenase